MTSTRSYPPKKKRGQGVRPRAVNGVLMDVRTGAAFLGLTEKTLRARVARRLIPFTHFGGRLVFVRTELETFMASLDGCDVAEALANMTARRG